MSSIYQTAFSASSINEIRFRIPLYQRPYAWEVFQVEQLLMDLHRQFKEDPNKKYYIGILNVGSTEQRDIYDLIDGQQRITTLCLIGSVLKLNNGYWNNFLYNRLNLYGRAEDQLFLENHESSTRTNHRMVEAVDVIGKYIEEKLCNRREAFSKYVYEKASFFISKVPDHYSLIDKNLQFVRMNNRGKQLEAHDVLKIKLATYILDETKRNEFIIKWNEFSQLGCGNSVNEIKEDKAILDVLKSNTIEKMSKKDTEIFYQSIVSYPEFLLIALARFFRLNRIDIIVSQTKEKRDEERQKHKLLEEFGFGEKKLDFDWSEEDVLGFCDVLTKQFYLFDKFIIKRDKEEKYKFVGDKERFKGTSLIELQVFQSFLYVTREPNQSTWLIEAFNYLDALSIQNNQINTNEFLLQLKTLDNERCATRNSRSLGYGSIDRYWFWRLDYYLWENRKEIFKGKSLEIAEKYVFRANRSIEHIAPQTPHSSNLIDLSSIILNSFGNLAMISSGQNSSLQNKSFEVKRAHVESFINGSTGGTIESLKMLDIYDKKLWREDVIKIHSNKMINVLIRSFPINEFQGTVSNLRDNL